MRITLTSVDKLDAYSKPFARGKPNISYRFELVVPA